MKRIYLCILSAGLFASSIHAQTPEKKSIPIVHKITATWCGPCGSWGWDLANEIIDATEPKALFWGLYASNSNSWDNADFYNTTAKTLADQITYGGYPDFGVNAIEKTSANSSQQGINTIGIKDDCIAAVDAFAATVPIASAASNVSINGNNITVTSKVQFWSAASGDYYLAAYIVEDGALHSQNGQTTTTTTTAHHGVLRASMTAASAWGEQIASGNINANQTYSKNFTFTVTENDWDKTKIKIYNVIWKKENNVYKFMNASLGGSATSIEELINTAKLNIAPNPTTGNLTVTMEAKKSDNVTFTICDITGRQLSNIPVSLEQGTNHQTIDVASLAPGFYMLNIQTENGTIQKKFVKQ